VVTTGAFVGIVMVQLSSLSSIAATLPLWVSPGIVLGLTLLPAAAVLLAHVGSHVVVKPAVHVRGGFAKRLR